MQQQEHLIKTFAYFVVLAFFVASNSDVHCNRIRSSKQAKADQSSIRYLSLSGKDNEINYTFARPVVKIYGDRNKFVSTITITPDKSPISQHGMDIWWLSQQRSMRRQPKHFYVSKFIKDTWMRAHLQCAAHNMKVATFNSPKQLNQVASNLNKTNSGVMDEFWISGVRELTAFGLNFLYFPSLVPFTPTNRVKAGHVEGTMTCVYLKLNKDKPNENITLNTGDCNSETRHVVCESPLPWLPPEQRQFTKIL